MLSYFCRAGAKLRLPIRGFEKSPVSSEILRKKNLPSLFHVNYSPRADYRVGKGRIALTALLLALGRRYQSVETDALVELDTKDQSDFEQYTLKLSNANVVDGAGAKFPEEFFRPQGAKVVDDEGPQVKDVVPGHTIPFLYNDHLGS